MDKKQLAGWLSHLAEFLGATQKGMCLLGG